MTTQATQRVHLAHLLDEHLEICETIGRLMALETVQGSRYGDTLAYWKAERKRVEERCVELAFESVPVLVVPHLPDWLRHRMFEQGRSYPVS